MMMGDLLAAARRSAGSFEAWLRRSDPALAGKVEQAAAAVQSTPGGYARMAVADFARLASEEDWATLVSALRNSDDPGSSCLVAMVEWRLAAPGCAAHSHAPHAPGGIAHG